MKKNRFKYFLKIILGVIICRLIIAIVNFSVGITLHILNNYGIITMKRASELLNLKLIIYLPLLIILIIFVSSSIWSYYKNETQNLLWKLVVLILTYVLFELW